MSLYFSAGSATAELSSEDLRKGLAQALNTLGANRAAVTSYGTGCYDSIGSFFEEFSPSSFDLAGTSTTVNSVEMTPSGGGYAVAPGTNGWFVPTSPDLGLSNDGLSGSLPLPEPALPAAPPADTLVQSHVSSAANSSVTSASRTVPGPLLTTVMV